MHAMPANPSATFDPVVQLWTVLFLDHAHTYYR